MGWGKEGGRERDLVKNNLDNRKIVCPKVGGHMTPLSPLPVNQCVLDMYTSSFCQWEMYTCWRLYRSTNIPVLVTVNLDGSVKDFDNRDALFTDIVELNECEI